MNKLSSKNVVYYLAMLSLVVFSVNARSKAINGLGEYSELGSPVFIAALETEAPTTDAQQLLDSNSPMSMVMLITAAKISQRRFITIWLETIAANTNSDAMLSQSSHLAAFSQLFQGPLLKNDRVAVRYTAANTLQVRLNDVELGTIESESVGEFFTVLLQSWLGDIPLSSELKRRLLAPENIDQTLLQTFNTQPYSEGRQQIAQQWRELAEIKRQEQIALATAESDNTGNNTDDSEPGQTGENAATRKNVSKAAQLNAVAASGGLAPASNVVAKAASGALNQASKSIDTSTKAAVKAAPQKPEPAAGLPVASANTPGKTPTDVAKLTSTTELPVTQVARVASPSKARAKPVDTANFIAADENSLRIRQSYHDQLNQAVLKYKTLPRRAFQRRWEDSVRVRVKIDRKGKILEVKMAQKSKHNVFNKQAESAVRQAEPFPRVPAEIPDQTFTFSVGLNYQLPY